jgi:hypothetical protein
MPLPAGRSRASRRSWLLPALIGLSACFTSSEGLEPPPKELYYPTGIAISPGGGSLFVASSDFDLQFNGGSVAAIAWGGQGGLRDAAMGVVNGIAGGATIAAACGSIGLERNENELLYPGPCTALNVQPFVRKTATIGAFASSAVVVARQDAPGARLFIPVRGDPSVTWFDIVDDRDPAAPVSPCGDAFCLECAGVGEGLRCGPSHRAGELAYENPRGLVLPVEPIGVAADADGEAIVCAHQTSKAASLIVNRWGSGTLRPTLQHYVETLADGPTGVASVPMPGIVKAARDADGNALVGYAPAFVLTHSIAAQVTMVRYEDDARSQPPRPFLTVADEKSIGVAADGSDSRGVAIDGRERAACEAVCATDLACLEGCLATPLDLYIANRSPASLIIGRIESEAARTDGVVTGVSDRIVIENIEPLEFGASNVVLGDVVGDRGELEPRVFVVAFDSRTIFAYDPVIRVTTTIKTGRGPHGVAVDARLDAAGNATSLLVVGHFTDSYLGVVDLDTRNITFGTMILTVGPPVPPRESQ